MDLLNDIMETAGLVLLIGIGGLVIKFLALGIRGMEEDHRWDQKKRSDAMQKTVELTETLNKQIFSLRSAEDHPDKLHEEIANVKDTVTELYAAVTKWR